MHMAMGVISLLSLLATVLIISRVGAGDEATLLAFKALVSSGDSRALASWNSSVQFCGWEGVTCSHPKSTRVVALVLYSRGLTGALSPALGNLTFLRTLNLSSNGLHGEIPTSLGHLRNLLMLDLSFNWLRGEIPASLGNLRRLQTLKLSYNSFTGTIPVNLSSCINMTYMALHSNKLGGHIPDKLGETLAALTVLSLRNNSFTGPIPASLSNMSYLQYLDLSNNQLFGSIPPGLTRIQSMQQFDISINNLSEYGEGCAVSPLGDIYSLGILLLEIFTGRSPTDEMFRDALDLPKFVRDALPDRALEIADTIIWLHGQTEDNIATSRIQECLVSVFMLGISCSKQQPQERPLIRDAAVEMHAIRDVYLEFVG